MGDREFARRHGLVSYMGFPLIAGGDALGVLGFYTKNEQQFSSEEVDFLTTLAGQAAVAIHNSELFEKSELRARELTALYSVATVVSQSLDVDVLLRSIMDKALEIFDFDAARVYLLEEDSGDLVLLAHEGFPENTDLSGRYKPGQGVTGRVFEAARPILFEDIQNDPEFQQMSSKINALNRGFRGHFSIPICVKGKTLGVIDFLSKKAHRFSPGEVRLIRSVADHTGIAVENAKLYRESRRKEETQRLLKEFSQDITSLDINSLLRTVAEKVRELFRVDMADVRILEEGKWHLRGFSGTNPDSVPVTRTVSPLGRTHWIVEHRGTLMIPDITPSEGAPSGGTLERLGIRGYLGVPLFSRNGEVIGVLRALSYQAKAYSRDDEELMQQLANGAAIAIENAQLFQQIEQRSRELGTLVEINRDIAAVLDRDVLLPRIAEEARKLLKADGYVIRLVEGEELVLVGSSDPDLRFRPRLWLGESVSGRIVTENRVFGGRNTDEDAPTIAEHREILRNAGYISFLGVPLHVKDRMIGTIMLNFKEERDFSGKEIELIHAFADQAAIAVRNAELYQETTNKARELSALYSVASAINQSLDIEQVSQNLMHQILEIFDFDAARVYFLDENRTELRLLAHEGIPKEVISSFRTYAPRQGVTGKVLERGEPLFFEDVQNDLKFQRMSSQKGVLGSRFRGQIYIPIGIKGKTVGVLNVLSKAVHRFSPNELEMIRSIADQLGIAVENANLYRESRRREEIQGLLKELSQDITSLDIDSLLRKLAERVRGLLRVDLADVRVLEGESWRVKGLSGVGPAPIPDGRMRTQRGRSSWMIENRKALMIPDITQEDRIPSGETLRGLGIRGYLGVPLLSKHEQVIGVLRALSYQPRAFTRGEVDLLQQLANGAAIAIENARLFETVQSTNRRLNRLLEEQNALRETLAEINLADMSDVLRKITGRAVHLLKVDHVQVRLLGKDGLLRTLALVGKGAERFRGRPSRLGGRSNWAIENRRPYAIKDISQDKEFGPGRLLRELGVKGFFTVPLISRDGQAIGVITFTTLEEREFSEDEIALAQQFSTGAAIAIENARLLSETKDRASELERLNLHLQEANRAKSDFTTAMSHELRTPLHVIIGYTDLIAEGIMGELNNEQKESLETIRHHSYMLVKLVRDVLTLARIGAKKMTLDVSTTPLEELIDHLRAYVDQLNRERRLEILWKVEQDLPPLATDHLKLEEILQNLIGNAYKFTEKGQIEVRVQALGKRRIEFAVADTGIGLEEGELERIFEEFHQSRDSHTGTQSGVGLGLSIVKKYLDLLQGEIRVESQLGAGTTFIFTLPYSIDLEPDQAPYVRIDVASGNKGKWGEREGQGSESATIGGV
jgi:GAF domain-containing protein/anti-sigma regulatory factor (Ser/Thr protein kinase)